MSRMSVVLLESDIALAGLQLQSVNATDGFTCTQLFTSLDDFLNSKAPPDIVILDLGMPTMDGLTAVPLIQKKFPKTAIIINSSKDDIGTIFEAISLGAVGYVDKSSFFETIDQVLRNVKKEGAYITPKIARRIFDYFQHTNNSTPTSALTQREWQVAYLIKNGNSYRQVADKCSISVDTVRMHIRNIYRKLDVNSKIQLANRITRIPVQKYGEITSLSA